MNKRSHFFLKKINLCMASAALKYSYVNVFKKDALCVPTVFNALTPLGFAIKWNIRATNHHHAVGHRFCVTVGINFCNQHMNKVH